MPELQDWTSSMASPEIPVNENFRALSWAAVYALNAVASSGLTWAYYGGQWGGFTVSGGTITLDDDADNYIVVNRSDGSISASTGTSDWDDTASFAKVYHVTTAAGLVTGVLDYRSGPFGVHGPVDTVAEATTQCIPIACSDETTALAVASAVVTFRMPFGFHLSEVRASLTTAQDADDIFTVDVLANGVSIFDTTITIENGDKSSTTATTPAVLAGTGELADDDEMTIDIVQIGSGEAAGLKVYLIGTKTSGS